MTRVYVCIKQVPDTETSIQVSEGKLSMDLKQIKWVLNPYDEFALEEALRLKEKKEKEQESLQVVALSLGPKERVTEALRTALGMGADEALLIDSPENLDAHLTAKTLGKAIEQEQVPWKWIFTGKLSIDYNQFSVSQMLAEVLQVPHCTSVSRFSCEKDSKLAKAELDMDIGGGRKEILQIESNAALLAANKGLNTPRYVSLPGIMKAKKKPLKVLSLESLGISLKEQKCSLKNFSYPEKREDSKILKGEIVEQVTELVSLLRDEAKIL